MLLIRPPGQRPWLTNSQIHGTTVCLLRHAYSFLPPSHVQVLHRYAGTVVATLAGHAHMDGMATDAAGIRHRVCKAVLETPPGRCAPVAAPVPQRPLQGVPWLGMSATAAFMPWSMGQRSGRLAAPAPAEQHAWPWSIIRVHGMLASSSC